MERFEHLGMMVFLILGLALVKLITSYGTLLAKNITAKGHDKPLPVKFYWVHNLLTVMILIGMIIFWWNSYPLNDLEFMPDRSWNLFMYIMLLGSPTAYFLMADFIVPEHPDKHGHRHKHETRRAEQHAATDRRKRDEHQPDTMNLKHPDRRQTHSDKRYDMKHYYYAHTQLLMGLCFTIQVLSMANMVVFFDVHWLEPRFIGPIV